MQKTNHSFISDLIISENNLQQEVDDLKLKLKQEKSMSEFWHTVAIKNGLTYDATVEKS